MTAEPGTRVLRPVGLSPAERISDSLRVWGLRGLEPVAARTSHSWEQIIGFGTHRVGVAPSALRLSFMGPNPVRNGSLVMSAGGPSAQRLTTRATRKAGGPATGCAGPVRSERYGRSTASAGAPRALVTGRGYPVTDAQLRRLELPASGPRPPVAATRIMKPAGPVTKDHGPGSSTQTEA